MREIKKQFRLAIKCGLGSVYFIVRDNPDIDFSHDIIKASLSNLAIDPQCEGDRAVYLARLIDIARKKELIIARILAGLAAEQSDANALSQLFELAAIFALRGNKKAKRAIYKRFSGKKIKSSEFCGASAILKIDGLKGLLFIAETRGKELLNDPDDWEDAFLVDDFQKNNPQIKVYAELEKAAAENKSVRKYLDTIKESERRRSKYRKTRYTYSKIKDNIEKMRMYPGPPNIAKDLTIGDIKKLAGDFQRETNPVKQEKYLRVFAKIKFPDDYNMILDIAKSQNSVKNRLVQYACETLSHFKADNIRRLAIDKLYGNTNLSDYLPLLISNYKKGDEALLKEIASRNADFDCIHSLAHDYIAIYTRNKTKACKGPLEMLYQKMNCGMHRYEIVKVLYDNNVLSEEILRELEYDSYIETRQFYADIMNKSGK